MSPQEKTKKEIAILKKIRHPNVVALEEVIDDPELKKIYMVLEHVECGEIVWRKKGLPHICAFERRRVERREHLTEEEEQYLEKWKHRHSVKEIKRAQGAGRADDQGNFWSLEYASADEDDADNRSIRSGRFGTAMARSLRSNPSSTHGSRASSRAPSRTQSVRSMTAALSAVSTESIPNEDDLETPGPLHPNAQSASALDGTMYGAYDDLGFRERSPSMADSMISHTSFDFIAQPHDPYADDFSYVPCFTQEQAKSTFRDIILGLEYLHFEGVVHRDIKPANLLWTKDHRVKISDFGVSYFGRPMRDGEPDETVSESEARDFDDDLELAKTVGTPAFFAPELCYTDLDSQPPPKVTEQIDVWSLGVTLYCLIFARIPFMAEDEFAMFRKIATEEVYIPTRRLRPVDPATSPKATSLYNRINSAPYRDDEELVYEEVDPGLRQLLQQMLVKDPKKRITLRGVKHHEWVIAGLSNLMSWMDDTDPYRRTDGLKIQVNDEELHEAVVPLTLLERARFTFQKLSEKVFPARSDRGESYSRRRATSSAASSVGGDSPAQAPYTPFSRDLRRKSLRGDADAGYFAAVREHIAHPPSEHPLTYSVTASPDESPSGEEPAPTSMTSRLSTTSVGGHPSHQALKVATDFNGREDVTDRQTPTPAQLKFPPRHTKSQSISNAWLTLTPALCHESRTVPTTPAYDDTADETSSPWRQGRDLHSSDDTSRSQSVDRAMVFMNADKRADAKVALSTLVAPGNVEQVKRPIQMRSMDLRKAVGESPLPSPLPHAPQVLAAHQHGQYKSDTSIPDKFRTVVELEERPVTAHRMQDVPEGKTPPPRKYNTSTSESFARAHEQNLRQERLEYEENLKRQETQSATEADPAFVPCPPSPDDIDFDNESPLRSRQHTLSTIHSSNSASADAFGTPLTSPSEVTSPMSMSLANSMSKDRLDHRSQDFSACQSDPSLPALLSGASSVSADTEGDYLRLPGVPRNVNMALLETTDSITPPAIAKESAAGFPIDEPEYLDENNGSVPVVDHDSTPEDDDDDSDSDDEGPFLMMGSKSRRITSVRDSPAPMGRLVSRRDTNASVGSTDTAKKIFSPDESEARDDSP